LARAFFQQLVAVGGSGKEVDAQPEAKVNVAAAKLELPRSEMRDQHIRMSQLGNDPLRT